MKLIMLNKLNLMITIKKVQQSDSISSLLEFESNNRRIFNKLKHSLDVFCSIVCFLKKSE